MNEDPITLWINELRQLDESAAEKLWRHFTQTLHAAARRRLNGHPRRVYDEEDAAQSAFHSVCTGILAGSFPDLHDRTCLWSLLLRVTARKVAQRRRYDHRRRRDVRRNWATSDVPAVQSSTGEAVEQVPSREPSPELAAEFMEVCELFFARLADSTLHEVVKLRLDGFTDTEIAETLNCSRRTVQRRLEAVRRHWQRLEADLE